MSQRPTIIDVARQAGVSKSTVSRVLQGDALVSLRSQNAVREAILQLGYEQNAVASSLRTERTWMVMLATPDITNPFWSTVARGAQDHLEAAGYSVVFANSMPTVVLGMRNDLQHFDTVGSDSFGGVMLALDHLYALGHRRIGFIRGQHKSGRGQSRHQAYQTFLQQKGLLYDPALVAEVPYELERGYQAACRLLENAYFAATTAKSNRHLCSK